MTVVNKLNYKRDYIKYLRSSGFYDDYDETLKWRYGEIPRYTLYEEQVDCFNSLGKNSPIENDEDIYTKLLKTRLNLFIDFFNYFKDEFNEEDKKDFLTLCKYAKNRRLDDNILDSMKLILIEFCHLNHISLYILENAFNFRLYVRQNEKKKEEQIRKEELRKKRLEELEIKRIRLEQEKVSKEKREEKRRLKEQEKTLKESKKKIKHKPIVKYSQEAENKALEIKRKKSGKAASYKKKYFEWCSVWITKKNWDFVIYNNPNEMNKIMQMYENNKICYKNILLEIKSYRNRLDELNDLINKKNVVVSSSKNKYILEKDDILKNKIPKLKDNLRKTQMYFLITKIYKFYGKIYTKYSTHIRDYLRAEFVITTYKIAHEKPTWITTNGRKCRTNKLVMKKYILLQAFKFNKK